MNAEAKDSYSRDISVLFEKIRKYGEEHPALFISIITAVVTIVSFALKMVVYVYWMGHNMFFNIPYEYIKISENTFYGIGLSIAGAILFILINIWGYYSLLKRAFLKHLFKWILLLGIIFFTCSNIVNTGEFKINILGNMVTSGFFAIIIGVVLNYGTILYALLPDNKVKLSRLNHLKAEKEEKCKKRQSRIDRASWKISKKIATYKKQYTSKKIAKLDEKIKKITDKENEKVMSEKKPEKKLLLNRWIVYCILPAFTLFAVFFAGYSTASNKKNIKTISAKQLDIKFDYAGDDYAVLFAGDGIYLICPSKVAGEEISLVLSEQVEIDKKDIVVSERTYKTIKTVKN